MYNYKLNSSNHKIGSLFVTVIIIMIITYIAFSISKSVWHNYEVNQKITNLNEEIDKLRIVNKNLQNLIVYYKSDTFKELEARRKLGMKKKDETMVILPENSSDTTEDNDGLPTSGGELNTNQNQNNPSWPNYLKWRDFIFE